MIVRACGHLRIDCDACDTRGAERIDNKRNLAALLGEVVEIKSRAQKEAAKAFGHAGAEHLCLTCAKAAGLVPKE